MKDSLLRISNITKNISVGRSIFNQKKIERLLYKNITFDLKRGEILGIIGLNRCWQDLLTQNHCINHSSR